MTNISLLKKLKFSLRKTKEKLISNIKDIFIIKDKKDDVLKKLEYNLINSDINIDVVKNIIKGINRYNLNKKNIFPIVKEQMVNLLKPISKPIVFSKYKPFIILLVGINGVGKTTTAGKISWFYKKQNKKILLVAGDTFRLAAIEQLRIIGKNISIPVISQNIGSDSGSLVFDAIKSAQAKQIDLVVIDTAGRLQNKLFLMNELQKIIAIINKLTNNNIFEIILVIDANTGRNAINQVTNFHKYLNINGIILTKLDSTTKGSMIFNISNMFNIPLRFISTGDCIDDLQLFEPNRFVNALFD
ncbi:MAG: signal recognition particle-docking protein FtsY [Candidatus Lightella neohaematopini]|nr:signal recognition particle-docking protein FtsY [Candidatus Lightella neohaematopini]MCV2529023.1 signal recognition particle-docking protein FtsY [Candidatus Lightella neohaematopini]